MQWFLYIIFLILTIIGVTSVIKDITYWLFRYDVNSTCMVLLLDDNKPEIAVRSAVEQIRWNNLKLAKILAVDCGMSEENKTAISLLLEDYKIPLLKKDEIGEKLTE